MAAPRPPASRAQASGNISINATFTDPQFDPYQGPGGAHGDDPWTWTDGQPDFLVVANTGGNGNDNGSDGGTSAILGDGFASDITAITAIPSSGNSITTSSGISLASSPTGSPGGNPLGSGGTWTLKNVGPIYSEQDQEHNGATIDDTSGDEFDMTWTYSATVHVTAGETIDFVTNPEYSTFLTLPRTISSLAATATMAP